MPIGFVEGVNSILQIVKLTQLMGRLGEDKGDRTANGVFSIRDDSFDRDLKLLELVFDFGEQGGQIALRTTEQRTCQQDLFGETVTYDPEHFMPDIWLQPINSQDHVPLLLELSL